MKKFFKYKRPEGIIEILDNENKSEYLEKILMCGVIVYDITNDLYCHPSQIEEAKWVAECRIFLIFNGISLFQVIINLTTMKIIFFFF